MKVIVTTPTWSLNGINIFAANLVRGLSAQGVDTRLLLTDPYRPDRKPMPPPHDVFIEHLHIGVLSGWNERWRTLIRYLSAQAPCIYLPNHDFRNSHISARLDAQIGIVGIVHSDDRAHYDHVRRLGRYWNAIVAVSERIAQEIDVLDPALARRRTTIPYGVDIPSQFLLRTWRADQPLKIVYAGRLDQTQKRVLDLPLIAEALAQQGVPFSMTIIGAGVSERELRRRIAGSGVVERIDLIPTVSNARVLAAFEQHDVFLLPSAYEGLPISLLEAMGRGCVPVVADVPSGIPELICDGENGWRVVTGDIETFAARLAQLHSNLPLRQQMSRCAHERLRERYALPRMIAEYQALLARVWAEMQEKSFVRPGTALTPRLTRQDHLMARVWSLTGRWRERTRRAV